MMKNRRLHIEKARPRHLMGQAGFTLLEGMIAAGLLAMGLLALAGMQGLSLGRNVDAHDMTRATNINADLMERIKFNRGRALAYHNINTNNAATQPPSTEPMARGDYTQWTALLNNSGLANAQGLVTVVRLDGDPAVTPVTLNRFAVTVQINWTPSAKGGEVTSTRTKTVTFASVLAPE
jgi:type IV pilus assembly protein PilV